MSGVVELEAPYLLQPPADYVLLETCLYDASLATKVPVHKLNLSFVVSNSQLITLPDWLVADLLAFNLVCVCAARRLKEKIEGGLIESATTGLQVLHTAPHHDDIMLSYHGAMHEMLGRQPSVNVTRVSVVADRRASLNIGSSKAAVSGKPILGEAHNNNLNHFAYLTSGFHSVNDEFLQGKVSSVLGNWKDSNTRFIEEAVKSGQLSREYDDMMSEFREAFLHLDYARQDHIENLIFMRKVAEVWLITPTQTYAALVEQITSKV